MCKLAVIPFIPKGSEDKAFDLIIALTGPMTARDSDGYGYMALGESGMFGHRWLNVDDAWALPAAKSKELSQFDSILHPPKPEKNSFGKHTKRVFGIAAHARMSTCDISLENVHPFVNESRTIGIVHNGVISNSAQYALRLSTCDSEAILHEYESNGLNDSFEIQNAIANLQGWYAFAAFTQNSNETWQIDIVKESRANLYCAYVKEIGAAIFVTDPQHLETACLDAGMTFTGLTKVRDNVAIRLNAETGATIATKDIVPAQVSILASAGVPREFLDPPRYREDYEYHADDDGPMDCVDAIAMTTDPFYYKRGA